MPETIKIVWKKRFTERVPELNDMEIKKHRHNIRQILESTNATPIRCHGGRGYACCFCEDQYEDPSDLKRHTLDHHSSMTKDFMKGAIMSKYIVKLDITALKCNLCQESLVTIEQLTAHLIKTHDIKFFTDIKSHVVPFKFDSESLNCAICPQRFTRFKGLLEHMSIHFRNYTCDVCDTGFVNRATLKNHATCHENGSHQCDVCTKTFASYRKMKMHEKSVHVYSHKTNRCGYCKELFKSHSMKEKHLTEVHGVKTIAIKCQACDKSFETQSQLRVHTKRDHLCERRFACSYCDMRFFLNHELQDHMVKHTGVRMYECAVCHKAYGRKKTLREHMRIHDDDRRFKCKHCSQAFVQKCSWRSHMRTKHGEDV